MKKKKLIKAFANLSAENKYFREIIKQLRKPKKETVRLIHKAGEWDS